MLCFGGQLRNNTINHKHACLKMSLKMSDEEGHVEAPAVVPWSCCWSYELYMLSIIHGCFQEIRFRKVDLKFTIVFFLLLFSFLMSLEELFKPKKIFQPVSTCLREFRGMSWTDARSRNVVLFGCQKGGW